MFQSCRQKFARVGTSGHILARTAILSCTQQQAVELECQSVRSLCISSLALMQPERSAEVAERTC